MPSEVVERWGVLIRRKIDGSSFLASGKQTGSRALFRDRAEALKYADELAPHLCGKDESLSEQRRRMKAVRVCVNYSWEL
jgi:hypothetical protein